MDANGNLPEPRASRRYSNAEMGTNSNQLSEVVDWFNGLFLTLRIPADASEEDLRRHLADGSVLCAVLRTLNPDLIPEGNLNLEPETQTNVDSLQFAGFSLKQKRENVKKFLLAVDDLGLPKFELSDLEQGSMTAVVECLLSVKDHFASNGGGQHWRRLSLSEERPCAADGCHGDRTNLQSLLLNGEEKQTHCSDSRFQKLTEGPAVKEPSSEWLHRVGQRLNEVLQLNGHQLDASAVKSSGMMNLNTLDNAPTQSILGLVNAILGEKLGEVSPQINSLLRKLMQEIERRLATQGEHIKKLKLALKEVLAREERLVSRAGVLETLASGTSEEIKIVSHQLQKIKTEKSDLEEKHKLEEQDVLRLMNEKRGTELAISSLTEELEMTKGTYEQRYLQLEAQRKGAIHEMEKKIKQLEWHLEESKREVEELEALSESRVQEWKLTELHYKMFIDNHLQSLEDIRLVSQAVKKEIVDTQKDWMQEINNLGVNLKGLADAAQNYHIVLDENRKLYNEVQDLKGNIRVYCRVRPFLAGQAGKQTTIEYIGEDGELLVSNPSKPGKDGQRMFKFNKVYGPTTTQEEVFMDTRPLIRSVLDGFNVCIFAYGQTGSGKTFTMSGPDPSLEASWGVNYRALNDLFLISQKRRSTYTYEIGVQMVEIYNEQVRDLLISDGPQKRLGIWSTSQPNGLSVPDASMHQVDSTSDVLALMQIGQMNRAVGATALNERSSRSHSVLTVHVRGTNLETGVALRGSLHLIDLAGSERVERSEATGDRLREAQHINKSLSALGDVIHALSQKNSHVPFRNSKLTQILQGSLGGQAKTLMFVQLNPDIESYSETISTLKFAERVSGVELGAAKSNKESKDVRDLMEQVSQLKDLVANKDAEIERLQSLKDQRVFSPGVSMGRRRSNSPKHTSSLSPRSTLGGSSSRVRRSSTGNLNRPLSSSSLCDAAAAAARRKAASDLDNYSEYSDKHSEASSQQSFDDFRGQKEHYQQPQHVTMYPNQTTSADVELLGIGDGDLEERLSDISDGGLSMGTETDGSMSSIVELTLFPEAAKNSNSEKQSKVPSSIPRPPPKPRQSVTTRRQSVTTNSMRASTSLRRSIVSQKPATTPKPPPRKWQ
ncbi:kinesin-like protein KIN-14C [Nymphaea colorata]|nr:kinesin-like protein KIN-14C [Nymphaea colorata]